MEKVLYCLKIKIKIRTQIRILIKSQIKIHLQIRIPCPLSILVMPNVPLAPEAPQRPQLNWSHFKPEYTGRPDEDAEAHLLRMNNWMDTHKFLEHIKVQRFCLTLVGEARLWYESLRLIKVDWVGLQNILGSNIQKQVIQGNNYFMHGDYFILMKM